MICWLVLLLTLYGTTAHSEIHDVFPGWSIQAAVDSASNGDTVLIHDGAYDETVVLYGKTLTVGSLFLLDGDTTHISTTTVTGTTVRPDTASAFVYAYGETSNGMLNGLTLSGQGTWSDWYLYSAGGAVYILQSAVRVHHCRIVDSWAQCGGGLDVVASAPGTAERSEVRDSEFRNCHDLIYAGGLHARLCTLQVVNTRFESDTSLSTAGGMDISMSQAIVDSCEFFHCYGRSSGGLIYYRSVGRISNCLFHENGGVVEENGAGTAHLLVVAGYPLGPFYVYRNIFRDNSTTSHAVDFLGVQSPHHFFGNLVEGNVVTPITGTLMAGNETFGDLAYNLIRHNRNVYGGTFYAFGSSRIRVHHNWFEGNVSDDPSAGSVALIQSYLGVIDSNVIVNNVGQTINPLFDNMQVDARNNWWGHPSGPYHPTLNPSGQGDTLLSDSVLFVPWLTEPPDTTMPQDILAVRERPALARTWVLMDAYPNPFNQSVTLVLAGFAGQDLEIGLYNLLGQQVDVVHRGALTGGQLHYQAPPHLASGVYLLSARDKHGIQTKKVILMK
jgi:hypothetical protein